MSAGKPRSTGNRDVLHIPAVVGELASVRRFVRRVASREGARREAIDDLVQAVDESVTNIIVHGYSGRAGTVAIEIERDGEQLVIRLRDRAPAFDPTVVPMPDLALRLELRPAGGMGVFLTRQLMDQVTYRRADDTNELTLVKQSVKQQEDGNVEADR